MATLNWKLLVICLSALVLATLYLFYLNRILAWLVSVLIRLSTWSKDKDRVYIDIESLTVSLVKGTVSLKNVRYHTSNQTIKMAKCSIVWRYWLRHPKELGSSLGSEQGQPPPELTSKNDHCRVHIAIQGMEWLMYNRIAAFDDLVTKMVLGLGVTSFSQATSVSYSFTAEEEEQKPSSNVVAILLYRIQSWLQSWVPSFEFQDLLPITFEVSKASLIVGNKASACLLLGQFQDAFGEYTIAKASSPQDLYKQIISVAGKECKLFLRENANYSGSIYTLGESISTSLEHDDDLRDLHFESFSGKSPEDKSDASTRRNVSSAERIFHTNKMEVTYIADVAGVVGDVPADDREEQESPPEWKVHIVVDESMLRYGPWADRQRAELQKIFFPPAFQDNHLTKRPRRGQPRLFELFEIQFEIRENLSIQIPFQEASKAWLDGDIGKKRDLASLHVKCGPGSSLQYLVPFLSEVDGYTSQLSIVMSAAVITTSASDIVLLSSSSVEILATMPSPLKWNESRMWTFNIFLIKPVVHLVRDHITFLTDLGKDWSSGPLSDFHTWVPVIYSLQVEFRDYALHLFVNDHNIIDYPQDQEENAKLVLTGAHLRSDTRIFSDKFRSMESTVPFAVQTSNVSIVLTLPKWDTRSIFSSDRSTRVGHVDKFRLDGAFRYFAEVQVENVDTFYLNMQVQGLVIKALGWFIRRLMVLRENYFGDFTNFTTLSEYMSKRSRGQIGDPTIDKGPVNLFEFVLEISLLDSLLVLPAGMPGFEDTCAPLGSDQFKTERNLGLSIAVSLPDVLVSTRNVDHGMDFSFTASPWAAELLENATDELLSNKWREYLMRPMLKGAGIDIAANRLFGPRPVTATYFCLWQIDIGKLDIRLAPDQLLRTVIALQNFACNYKDILNSPSSEFSVPEDPDVTVLHLRVGGFSLDIPGNFASVWLVAEKSLHIQFQNIPGPLVDKVLAVSLPELRMHIFSVNHRNSSTRHEVGFATCRLGMNDMGHHSDYINKAKARRDFVLKQDEITQRVSGLFTTETVEGISRHAAGTSVFLRAPAQDKTRQKKHGRSSRQIGNDVASETESGILDASESNDKHRRLSYQGDDVVRNRISQGYRHHNPYGDDSITSGDEAGESDTSAEVLSDSDSGHLEEGALSYYPYLSQFVKAPGDRLAEPYVCRRERRTHLLYRHDEKSGDASLPTQPSTSEVTGLPFPPKAAQGSSVRMLTMDRATLFISPLLGDALCDLLTVFFEHKLSLELSVDQLWAGLLSSSITSEPSVVPLFRLKLLDLEISALSTREPTRITGAELEAEATMLLIRLPLVEMSTGLSLASQTVFDFQACRLSARILDVRRKPFRNRFTVQDSLVLSVSVDTFRAGKHLRSTFAHLGNMDVRFTQKTPEYAGIFWNAYSGAVRNVKVCVVKQTRAVSQFKKFALWMVLDKCQSLGIINPLSLVKRSHLVQRQALRTGVSYNMVTYLRICLAAIGSSVKSEIISKSSLPRPKISQSDIENPLRRRWGEWTNDPEGATHVELPLLNALYGRTLKTIITKGVRSSDGLDIQIGRIFLQDATFAKDQSFLDIGPLSASCLFTSRHDGESQVSGNMKPAELTKKTFKATIVSSVITNLVVQLYPSFLEFLQECLRATKEARGLGKSGKDKTQKRKSAAVSRYVEVWSRVDRLRIRATAQNLLLDTGISNCSSSLSLMPSDGVGSPAIIGTTARAREFFVRARSATQVSEDNDTNVLASTLWTDCMLSARTKPPDREGPTATHALCSAGRVLVSIPKSAKRTFQFINEWRADFLPPIAKVVKSILAEMRPDPNASIPANSAPSKRETLAFTADFFIARYDMTLQVTHGMWLSWNFRKILAGVVQENTGKARATMNGSLAIESQSLSIESSSTGPLAEHGALAVKLALPAFKLLGIAAANHIRAKAEVEYFKMHLRPTHLDDLLMVQKHLGSTFDELLAATRFNREQRATPARDVETTLDNEKRFSFDLAFFLKGFQIGVPSPTTTLFLNSSDISGSVMAKPSFASSLYLNDFALSLAPQSSEIRDRGSSGVHHRSAFILLDLEWRLDDVSTNLKVTKLHAVMSPSSISEFGDLLDFFQLEVKHRQEQRAAELTEIRSRTRNLLRTFDSEVVVPKVTSTQPTFWTKRTIKLELVKIGIAFPLAHSGHDVFTFREPRFTQSSMTVRAFIFSIESISFEAQQATSGTAAIKKLSFQFVPKFNQASQKDFDGLTHETLNRLLYPELFANLTTVSQRNLRKMNVISQISGFLLDLEPSVVDYVFALVDVYRHGRERFERLKFLAESEPGSPVSPVSPTRADQPYGRSEAMKIPTSNILMSLHFISGTVSFHPSKAQRGSWSSEKLPRPLNAISNYDSISLPSLTVWAEFKATSASHKMDAVGAPTPPQLVFKSIIHASENELRPSLLPFITEVTGAVEHHLRHDFGSARSSVAKTPLGMTPIGRRQPEGDTFINSLQIIFSVKIDQSQLQLTCQPDVNVLAALQWESGGFVAVVSPGARSIGFTGTIAGLSLSIRHGYLLEKCAEVDARNLAFTVNFSRILSDDDDWVNSVSIVIDTELSAGLRLSRLQDVLCFRAVWLDRIPVLKTEPSDRQKIATPFTQPMNPIQEKFVTSLLLRARTMKLAVDMGSNITEIQLTLETLLARTHLTDTESEIELSVKRVHLNLLRNLSGSAVTPDFRFHTLRRRHGLPINHQGKAKTLQMNFTSGDLDVILQSEGKRILHYHAQPLEVTVFDDLSETITATSSSAPHLNLVFTVKGGSVISMVTIGAIPRILDVVGRVKLLIQEQKDRAEDESELFRYAQSLKPDNPLTAVANAMIQNAKTRFGETDSVLGYVMVQRMTMSLGKLQLAIFYRHTSDHDMALFTGTSIHADLEHVTDSRGGSLRNDLHLSLRSMSISKITSLNQTMVTTLNDNATTPEWLQAILKDTAESTVFKLPAMDIRMSSRDVSSMEEFTRLEYQFLSKFPLLELEGDKSLSYVDTEISLNIQLYKWLAEFRSRLTAELARVQARNTGAPPALVESASHATGLTVDTLSPTSTVPLPDSPQPTTRGRSQTVSSVQPTGPRAEYIAISRDIQRPTILQLGDATPDILHPFFSKQAGFKVEEQLPVYIHEYATLPLEQIMTVLLKLYSRQFKSRLIRERSPDNVVGRVKGKEKGGLTIVTTPSGG